MATIKLSNGGELTEDQITALRGIFTPTEINDIVSALHEKSQSDYAAAKQLDAAKDIRVIQTLTVQAEREKSLAEALEVCQ